MTETKVQTKKRGSTFTLLLGLFTLSNITTILTAVTRPSFYQAAGYPSWMNSFRVVASICFLICLYGISKWKKWGVYGYGAVLSISYLGTILSGKVYPIFLVLSIAINVALYWWLIKPVWKDFE